MPGFRKSGHLSYKKRKNNTEEKLHSPQSVTLNYNHHKTKQLNDKHNTTLKILCLNCRSIRSLNKRNELAVLLNLHDIDIVFGTESHIDHTYFSSELLPKSYKVLRKDRCLGG